MVKVLRCRLRRETYRVGDHNLVLGEVVEVLGEEAEQEGTSGLGYAGGRYRRIEEVIEVEGSGADESV